MVFSLYVAIFLSGLVYIFCLRKNLTKGKYFFKPFTTVLIILLGAFLFFQTNISIYSFWILLGLLFSLLGDIFLMLPKDRFLHGLGAFLIAHICYISAFTNGWSEFITNPLVIGTYYLFAFVIYFQLHPALFKQKNPGLVFSVIFYIIIITWMGIQSFSTESYFAIIGSILFIISDGTLAIGKFKGKIPFGDEIVMVTYYTAQTFIVLTI